MFMILDKKKLEIFYSDHYKKITEIQKEVGFHPSYNCHILFDDTGMLAIENSCGELRYSGDYMLIEYIKED
ncbi:MAG: hypothetical protein AMQ22_00006 [Candidatus Methanofastidiosum methylothiophilum]|uniref:Uncharacterized protein n=1 Tax=Candidatus Methanofastidiosum methylothiophilum TaxID=1705564 RepID=A0A150J997_9EURY|nr:MAG: hypothetical protein AMQ22_00006 [Candidatus Methanofastidiosum methylthiophilus]